MSESILRRHHRYIATIWAAGWSKYKFFNRCFVCVSDVHWQGWSILQWVCLCVHCQGWIMVPWCVCGHSMVLIHIICHSSHTITRIGQALLGASVCALARMEQAPMGVAKCKLAKMEYSPIVIHVKCSYDGQDCLMASCCLPHRQGYVKGAIWSWKWHGYVRGL